MEYKCINVFNKEKLMSNSYLWECSLNVDEKYLSGLITHLKTAFPKTQKKDSCNSYFSSGSSSYPNTVGILKHKQYNTNFLYINSKDYNKGGHFPKNFLIFTRPNLNKDKLELLIEHLDKEIDKFVSEKRESVINRIK